MDALPTDLRSRLQASPLLGYLNFSDGRPDVRFQRQLNEAYTLLLNEGDPAPWLTLPQWLSTELETLHASGAAAFREITQARAVLPIAFQRLPRAYREHHHDLLAHQADGLLFGPFFLAKACEMVLSQGPPWDEDVRILTQSIARLNDYVGHRPIALLETRPQTEYYPHERVRPIPLYLRNVGTAPTRYQALIEKALAILESTRPDLLNDAFYDPDACQELALDPRGYDHHHPVNRRPNYLFGEWDPHHIDIHGRYDRLVLRQVTLDALCDWMGTPTPDKLLEAGTVLAGTILMASGVCGAGPGSHGSSTTLTNLVPRIARYRDRFYNAALQEIPGVLGEHLRAEALQLRQPFASVRQHLNQALAKQRAFQVQERQLAISFAEMGYPEASNARARQIPVPSVRILAEIHLRQATCRLALQHNRSEEVPPLLAEVEALLRRGIECGALADPWNILGFQGLFPLFQSREDSTRDPRVEELLGIMAQQFQLYASSLAAAAIAGRKEVSEPLQRGMEELAEWWDRYATSDVSDLSVRVHGGERTQAALHVAQSLAAWQARPAAEATDLGFWRRRQDGFRTSAAYAQVIEALIRFGDRRAAFGLLMTWLADAESVPLEEPNASFQHLLMRWFTHYLASPSEELAALNLPLQRVFELLEVNADPFWRVPRLTDDPSDDDDGEIVVEEDEDEDDVFGAAYEEMSYRDSTDDGEEGSVIGSEPRRPDDDFPIENHSAQLSQQLQFLTTVAKLWQLVAPREIAERLGPRCEQSNLWLESAREMHQGLLIFLDELGGLKIPDPVGEFDAMIEFDRRRAIKESLMETALTATVEVGHAARMLTALQLIRHSTANPVPDAPAWERMAIKIEAAIHQGQPETVRRLLPVWLDGFRHEPLLLVSLNSGGQPRAILRARTAQGLVQSMLERLPKLGLVRETYHLVKLARQMEQNPVGEGQRISEFDRVFRIGVQSIVETLLDGAPFWVNELGDKPRELTRILWQVANSLMQLWVEHSNTLQLSILESMEPDTEWERLRVFIQGYGNDLFTVQFLALANMRAILHRGTLAYLEGQLEQPDGPQSRLVQEIAENQMPRERAARMLEVVLRALIEHYKEYCDYNATTAHSDYGENLHQFFDFLRLKVRYERFAWRMRPMFLSHEVLCRRGYEATADRWRMEIANGDTGRIAEELLESLRQVEAKHGIRLRTVRDRLEERFVQPLTLDRLCAMVEPAMHAVATKDVVPLTRLEEQIRPFTDEVIGGGLELPTWLKRFEAEVQRIRESVEEPSPPSEALTKPPLTFGELEQQLAEWEQPILAQKRPPKP